jgi:hypothetical protein
MLVSRLGDVEGDLIRHVVSNKYDIAATSYGRNIMVKAT